jgi:NADH-quinone oxidoreductase subunit G
MAMPECNSVGAALLGGEPLEAAYDMLDTHRVDVAIVLENDVSRRAVSRGSESDGQDIAHNGIFWIALDHLDNGCTRAADVLLPAATFAEGDGTLVNHEGRAQRYYQVFVPSGEVRESWRWLRDIARILGDARQPSQEAMIGWNALDDVVRDLCRELPMFRAIEDKLPTSSLRVAGRKIPRQPERYSGRTAVVANVTMHEPPPPVDPDSPFAFTMEGSHSSVPPSLQPQFWAPGWNSNQALNKFQEEVGGPLRDEMLGPRLIEPVKGGTSPVVAAIPPAFQPRPAEWLALPRYEIFGSEELSASAAALSTRIPPMSVVMHPDDAARMKWTAGDCLQLSLQAQRIRLPLMVDEAVPLGTVTVSRLRECLSLRLPGWCRLEKERHS